MSSNVLTCRPPIGPYSQLLQWVAPRRTSLNLFDGRFWEFLLKFLSLSFVRSTNRDDSSNFSIGPLGKRNVKGSAFTAQGYEVKLHEPGSPTASNRYRVTWERECIDLAELARLRWIERWRIERIAAHLNVGTTSVKRGLRAIEADPELAKIDFGHRKKRPWAVGKVFRGK